MRTGRHLADTSPQHTDSVLLIPLWRYSDRELLSSKKSVRKSSGTLPVDRLIAKIAGFHLRNIQERHRCILPGSALMRMFLVGTVPGNQNPLKVRRNRARLGSMKTVLRAFDTFRLRKESVLLRRNRIRSALGSHRYSLMHLKMVDRSPRSTDSDELTLCLRHSYQVQRKCKLSGLSRADSSLLRMGFESQILQ